MPGPHGRREHAVVAVHVAGQRVLHPRKSTPMHSPQLEGGDPGLDVQEYQHRPHLLHQLPPKEYLQVQAVGEEEVAAPLQLSAEAKTDKLQSKTGQQPGKA